MRVETERLYLYPISDDEMQCLIDKEADTEMKQAYTEMLEDQKSSGSVLPVSHVADV